MNTITCRKNEIIQKNKTDSYDPKPLYNKRKSVLNNGDKKAPLKLKLQETISGSRGTELQWLE